MTVQPPLFPALKSKEDEKLIRVSFSHNDVCAQAARLALEKRYAAIFDETDKFNRKLVSYQGNKGELVHGWIRYREGFSAQLVEDLIKEFDVQPGETIFDPFSGSATTLLVAKAMGINAVGTEILSVCHLAWQAKSLFQHYNLNELRKVLRLLSETEPGAAGASFPHIPITAGAFSETTENDLMYFSEWFEKLEISIEGKTLAKLILTSILEEVSFTRKDGQYLRWDHRSPKIRERNKVRVAQGKKPITVDFGPIPKVKQALLRAFEIIIQDIQQLQLLGINGSQQNLIKDNTLLVLPKMEANQFAGVITSPPYCNRYDYTRTYALELAYLGEGENIGDLRQSLLSCTVENRSKVSVLKAYYEALGLLERYQQILETVKEDLVFREVNEALQARWERGDMNNKGVLRMVRNYFLELTFIFAELFRVCRPGAHVAFVNDNVRYGGEIIPVDTLTTSLAEQLGFEPIKIYVLRQRKGNSSQQMGKFGREALRKSITIWRKPFE